MNCRKVRRLLNDKNSINNLDLIRHLKACPSCAREASASELLASALHQELKAQPSPETPLNIVRAKVEAMSKQKLSRENTIMSHLILGFNRRPRLLAGFGLALMVFLFVTLVPFPYTRTVGYAVSFEKIGNIGGFAPEQLSNVLGAMGYNDIKVTLNGGDFKIAGLPTRQAAREAALAFQKLTGITAEPIISQVTQRVSGSLFAQVAEKQRKIEIDAAGMSNAEIENAIMQKLAEAGYQAKVSVTTDASGERRVSLEMSRQAGDSLQQEQITIKNLGNGPDSDKIGIPLPIQVKVETEGKTDAEIIQEVKDKLAAEGITNPEVTVTVGPDGKKRVEVKVQKEEHR